MNAHTIKEYILSLENEIERLRYQDSEISVDDANVQLANRFYNKAAEEENLHKKRAYNKAGDIIKNLHFEVTCGEEILHLKGIGRTAARLIDEWLKL